MHATPPPLHSPNAVLDEDSTGWLVTFSDIVLQLFAFLLIVGVTRSGAFLTSGSHPVHTSPPSVATDDPSSPPARADNEDVALIEPDEPVRRLPVRAQDNDDAATGHTSRRGVVLPPEDPVPSNLRRPYLPAVTQATADSPGTAPLPARADAPLRRLIAEMGLTGAAVVDTTQAGFILSLGEAAGYPPGSTEAPASLAPLLAEVRRVLVLAPQARLEIDGHADARPIRTRRFPSNLELSVARAASVARAVVGNDDGLRRRTSVTGHAEGRPVADNRDDAGRARNRRVELRVLLAADS